MRSVWIWLAIGCGSPTSGGPDDSEVAEDCATPTVFFADVDGDGFGDPSSTSEACSQPSGFVTDASDCDDASSGIHPAAAEICDPADTDENCNGSSDEDDPTLDAASRPLWSPDRDGDGYGDPGAAPLANCDGPSGAVDNADDCDDDDAAVNPDAVEICDPAQVDEDCNGLADDEDAGVDPGTQQLLYVDGDGDGFGDENNAGVLSCRLAPGLSATNDDCDDLDAGIHLDADEVCDAFDVDENCDGLADDNDPNVSDAAWWYPDIDGDGFGDFNGGVAACDAPFGYIADGTDCDDTDPVVGGGGPVDVILPAVTNQTVDYDGVLGIAPNRIAAYWSNGTDTVGWVLFDLAQVADLVHLDQMTFILHGENLFGSPQNNPETVILRSPDDAWDRNNADKYTISIGEEISPVVTTQFDPTTWNEFDLDPGLWDWSGDVQDGFLTVGIDNILVTYSYVYFLGIDDPQTAPQLRVVGTSCI